jgi:nucleotide-binding universal stress UspA family protein
MRLVLLPADGSESALRAVGAFCDLARTAPGMHAILLNVEPAVPLMQRMVDGRPGEVRRIEEPLRAAGERLLARAKAELERAGVRCTAFVEFGDPADTIVARAKEWSADLIVMGTHGRGAIGSLLLGSVAQKVLQRASVPVMLVK